MKRRFVGTIGIVMLLAISAVGVLQYALFRAEQFRLIDSRIESTATLLISSDLTTAELKEFEEAEDIISEVVGGGEKFNQFIIVYGKNGKELYRSPTAEILPDNVPLEPKWQTIESDGHFIRVLTVPLVRASNSKVSKGPATRILQTGLILDDDILRLKTVNRHVILYSILILCLILLTTAWLSEALLKPLQELAHYLRYVSRRAGGGPNEPEIAPPESLARAGDDEFGQLVKEAYRIRDLLGKGMRSTQVWTAQMAHEMKTPLTILQNTLERAKTENDAVIRERWLNEATSEIGHLNGLISSFLEWSEAENFQAVDQELHASRLVLVATKLVENLQHQAPGRVRIEGDSRVTVFAKRGFVKQAISNLVTNSLRYSPVDSPVILRLRGQIIQIIDDGPGVPPGVLQHLGEPFNYGGKDLHGFGLGLAWVRTICRKYDWKLSFERAKESDGREVTVAQIIFPDEAD